jgi:hypothetical protein
MKEVMLDWVRSLCGGSKYIQNFEHLKEREIGGTIISAWILGKCVVRI